MGEHVLRESKGGYFHRCLTLIRDAVGVVLSQTCSAQYEPSPRDWLTADEAKVQNEEGREKETTDRKRNRSDMECSWTGIDGDAACHSSDGEPISFAGGRVKLWGANPPAPGLDHVRVCLMQYWEDV